MFGGKCFDITVDTPENASLLAQAGFDYDHTVKPLQQLGARSIHVSIFVSVEYPDVELIPFLKTYGKMRTDTIMKKASRTSSAESPWPNFSLVTRICLSSQMG